MRSIETEGAAGAERQRIGVALRTSCGELVEVVEVARELGDAVEELDEALRVAEVRRGLKRDIDVAQAQHLAGAGVDEHAHGVFEDADGAFEHEPVFGPVGEACDFFGVCDGVHHLTQPAAHEFTGPRDRVEREQDAQEDEEHLTHGWEYNPGPWGCGIWGGLSYKLWAQVVEIMRDDFLLSCSFGSAPSHSFDLSLSSRP